MMNNLATDTASIPRAIPRRRKTGTRSQYGACRGQSMVEFALVVPILMILAFGIVDFGLGIRTYISLTNATREGARYAAVGNPPGSYPSECGDGDSATVVARVCSVSEGLNHANLSDVAVEYPDGEGAGNSVVVSASYTYHYVTPLGDIIHFFSGGTLSETFALSTSTDMRLE